MMKSFKRLVPCLSILAINFASCSSMLLDPSEVEAADQAFFEDDHEAANAFFSNGRSVRTYSVTWKNALGEVLRIDNVQEGEMPNFGGNPVSYSDGYCYYEFERWTPSLSPVYSNAFYTANYRISSADFYLSNDEINGGYKIIGPRTIKDTVEIPQTFNGKPITGVFFDSSYPWDGVKKVVFSDSVISVGKNSLYNIPVEEIVFGTNTTDFSIGLFNNSTSLKKVTFGEGVKAIPNNMFANCTSLTNVVLNDQLESIGDHAFSNCLSLKTLDFPSSLATIGNYAFYNSGVEELTLPLAMNEIAESAFNGCSGLVSIQLPEYVTTLGPSLFKNCVALDNVSLPMNTTSVPQYLFQGCENLNNVELHEGIAEIGKFAFNNCLALTNVNFPSTLKNIGECAFYRSNIKSAVLPQGTRNIDEQAFANCKNLSSLSLPSSLQTIGKNAFSLTPSLVVANYEGSKTAFDAIDINASNYELFSVPKVYNSYNNQTLTDDEFLVVYLDENRNVLEVQKHTGDESYEYTGETPTKAGDASNEYVFTNWNLISTAANKCKQFAPVFQSIKNHFKATFDYKNGNKVDLYFTEGETINYPAAPENGSNIFCGWDNDYSTMPASNLTFNAQYVSRTTAGQVYKKWNGNYAFYSWDQVINDGIVRVSNNAVESVTQKDSVANDDVLILPNTIKTINNIAFFGVKRYKEIVLQSGLTTIKEDAFVACKAKKINIPSTVTTIEQNAFASSSITSASLPSGISTVAESIFSSCSSLASVTLPNTITTIEYGAFNSCASLSTITLPTSLKTIADSAFEGSGLTSIVIPEGTTSIGNRCFMGSRNLKTVTLPSSISSIGFWAFKDTSINTINYRGSKSQFDSLKFDDDTKAQLANITINYNC